MRNNACMPDLGPVFAEQRHIVDIDSVLSGEVALWSPPPLEPIPFRLTSSQVKRLIDGHRNGSSADAARLLRYGQPRVVARELLRRRLLPPSQLDVATLRSIIDASRIYRAWLSLSPLGRLVLARTSNDPKSLTQFLNRWVSCRRLTRLNDPHDAWGHLRHALLRPGACLSGRVLKCIVHAVHRDGFRILIEHSDLADYEFGYARAMAWTIAIGCRATYAGAQDRRSASLFNQLAIIDRIHARLTPSRFVLPSTRVINCRSLPNEQMNPERVLECFSQGPLVIQAIPGSGVHVVADSTHERASPFHGLRPTDRVAPFDLSSRPPEPVPGTRPRVVHATPLATATSLLLSRPDLLPEVNFLHHWSTSSSLTRARALRMWRRAIRHVDPQTTIERIIVDVQQAVSQFLRHLAEHTDAPNPEARFLQRARALLLSPGSGRSSAEAQLYSRLPGQMNASMAWLLAAICCLSPTGTLCSGVPRLAVSTAALIDLAARPVPGRRSGAST